MKARIPRNVGGGAQNMNQMIKQAQKMQDQITELQEDIDMLQDLIISAVNEAVNNVEATTESEMSKITGGVSLPGLF